MIKRGIISLIVFVLAITLFGCTKSVSQGDTQQSADLEIFDINDYIDDNNYYHITGKVRNNMGITIQNVDVQITYFTKEGNREIKPARVNPTTLNSNEVGAFDLQIGLSEDYDIGNYEVSPTTQVSQTPQELKINIQPIWPQFQNSSNNNGLVNLKGPDTADLKCKTEPLNHYLISSSPIVGSDGTIYIGTFAKKLYAINPDDCSIKWVFGERETTNAQVDTPVIGGDGTIYFTNGNKIFALDPGGTKKWVYEPQFDFGFDFKYEPKYYQGTVWIGGTYTLVGINEDGTEKCRFTSEGNPRSSGPSVISAPTIYKDNIYITDLNNIYKLDLNCNKMWKHEGDRFYHSVPVIVSDKIYVSNFNTLFTFDLDGNRESGFEVPHGSTTDSNRAPVIGDKIYTNDGNKFTILNHGGSLSCVYSAEKEFSAAPLVDSRGRIYIGNENGKVYVIDKDCNVVWTYDTGDSIEVAGAFGKDNDLIIASEDKRLYIFRNNNFQVNDELEAYNPV